VLHVLENIGLEVHHDEARDILKKTGAWVEGNRVRIPQYLVKRSLETAPRSFTIYARDGNPKHDIHIGPGRAHFGPGPTPPNFTDVETLERRPYVKDDARIVATVVDALPNIDFCESLGTVSDVHPDLAAPYEFAEMFPNTSKPIVAWSYGWDDSEDIHKIAVAEAGGQEAFEKRPNYVHYCEPLSPLVSTFEAVDKLIFAARNRVPLIFTPCPLAGGTAPVTAAGIIIQAAAESWMGLTLAQAIQPGVPFFMGGVLSVMDMNAMILSYGAPELSLMMAGATELAHFAGLPLWQTGGCTDSKVLDQQAALEGSISCYFSALTGGDLCHDVGYTESGITGSILQTVMMDEAIGYSRRITRGIEVNEDTLATDPIHNVGGSGDRTYPRYSQFSQAFCHTAAN
jgi:trimethylamine--corrinoid protein Co-methyltransferase